MAGELAVAVLTPSAQVVKAAVDAVTAPSVCGQVTVLPSHAPLLANLAPGVVQLRAATRQDRYFITGGFLEVANDRVAILATGAEPVEKIDGAAAKRELAEAEAALQGLDATSDLYQEAWNRVERARARVLASAGLA